MTKWFLVLLSALLILAGCSGGAPEGDTVTTDSLPVGPVEGTLKVALLTPGPVSDSGWSAMAYEGLKNIESELGAETAHVQATDSAIKDNMRRFAQDGYNLIIGHGFEYNEPALEVAKDFPKTVFVSSSGDGTSHNVGTFRFYLEQAFYVAGYLAGELTKTDTVAMIGGPDIPSIRSTFKAFEAGAKASNAGITIIEKFTGEEADTALAKQATEQAIRDGADFVIHQANAAASGVFDACAEHNVYCFGANLDQNSDGKTVIGSAVIKAQPAFLALAKDVKEGTFKGEVRLMGMKDGAIAYIPNPKCLSVIPAEVQGRLDELQLRIITGKLVVPKDDF